MFRKNSWIVALLLVLSLSVFFGCIEVIEEVDTEEYTYVELGTDYNTWGGQAYQSGWSTDGASWNDPNHTVKNLGLKLEDFKNARYLEIELNVDSTAGAVDIIWGNESSGWNQTNSVAPGGAAGPLKIDLTKLDKYANYAASTSQIRIIIQYNQPGQVKGLVKSAKLAIPSTPIFIPDPCDNPECRDPECILGKAKCPNRIDIIYQNDTYITENGTVEFYVNLNDWRMPNANDPKDPPRITYPGFNDGITQSAIDANLTQEATLKTAIAAAEKAYAEATDANKTIAELALMSAYTALETFYNTKNVTSIKAYFTKHQEKINFKFTPEQTSLLRAAGSIQVQVVGTLKANPGDAVDQVRRGLQLYIGNARSASNWNATGAFEIGSASLGFFGNYDVDNTGSFSFANAGTADNFNYLIVRHTGTRTTTGGGNTDAKTELEIESIKFILGNINATTSLNINLTPPATGAIPQTTFTGSDFTGAVTWVPAPINGVFAPRTEYYANIVITPSVGKFIPNNPSVTVNGKNNSITINDNGTVDDTSDDILVIGEVSYNPATRTVTSGMFPRTGAEKVLTVQGGDYDEYLYESFTQVANSSILWSMADWTGTSMGNPFVNAGGSTSNFSVVAGGINFSKTAGGGAWVGLDCNLTQINGIDPTKDKIKATIMGFVLSSGAVTMNVQGNAGAYTTIGTNAVPAADSDEARPFVITGEIPQGYISGGQNCLRINTTTDVALSARVALIILEKTGTQSACTCASTPSHASNACTPCNLGQICTCTDCTTCNPNSSGTAGQYTAPTDANPATEFYLDLGSLANVGNSPRPNQKYDGSTGTTFYFNKKAQRVAIPLTPSQSSMVKSGLDNDKVVLAMIDGTLAGTVTGSGSNLRFIFGDAVNATTFNSAGAVTANEFGWSGSKWYTGRTAAKFEQDPVNASKAANTNYFIIDADPLTQNTTLFAKSIKIIVADAMPAVTINAAANDTLFVAVGDFQTGGGTSYTYDGNKYWVVTTAAGFGETLNEDDGMDAANMALIQTHSTNAASAIRHTRIGFMIDAASPFWNLYSNMEITYDLVMIAGTSKNIVVRNNKTGASGADIGYPDLTQGTGNVYTASIGSYASGGFSLCKNNNSAFLLRITKVELKP